MMSNKRKMIVDILTEVFAIYDPNELISIGCPSDEYKPEAKPIAEYLEEHGVDRKLLPVLIQESFCMMLMCQIDDEVADEIAELAYNKLKKAGF